MSNVRTLRPMTTPVHVTVTPLPTARLPHGTTRLLAEQPCLPVPVMVAHIALETLATAVLDGALDWREQMRGAFDALVFLDILEAAGEGTAVSGLRDDLTRAYRVAEDMLQD